MLCSQNTPKQKWLQSISMLSLKNDTVKTGTAFWRHFVHEHIKPSYFQKISQNNLSEFKSFQLSPGYPFKRYNPSVDLSRVTPLETRQHTYLDFSSACLMTG